MGIYTDLQERAKSDPDGVLHECAKLLDKNRSDSLAIFLMGQIWAEAERFGAAHMAFLRVTELRPEKAEGWNNLGMALEGLKEHDESMRYFEQAWAIDKRANYASNIGNCYLSRQNYKKAVHWANKALEIDPECRSARSVLGMASLALNDWATGWDNYATTLGGKFRKELQFADEPRWNGEKGKTVVVYGEQGLGDEIMYASCIPDIARDCQVILECDKRLEGLFKRSFPTVSVYGTRRQDVCPWIQNHKIDANCAIGNLPKFYRRTRDSFPRVPYLTPDPERVEQWKTLLKGKSIGIAWSGGSKHNNPEARNIGLENFRPLIESFGGTVVSLQYKDPTEEIRKSGLPIKHWKRATEGDDYDETAALVASLDLVVGVHTSVHHLAGALGVPGIILVPDKTLWNYANDFAWYPAKLIRQDGNWQKAMEKVINDPLVRGL